MHVDECAVAPLNVKKAKGRKEKVHQSKNYVNYQVDTMPINIEGVLHITLKPQEVTLCFRMTAAGDNICFQLHEIIHHNRISDVIEVISDQILRPICTNQEIRIEDGIMHLFQEDELHLRILQSQMGKIWYIEDNHLVPFVHVATQHNWSIMITDHNNWSTGHL